MAEESPVLVSLVEEFVSGLQDSKAKDTAAGGGIRVQFDPPLNTFAFVSLSACKAACL